MELLGKVEFGRDYSVHELTELNQTNITTTLHNISAIRKFQTLYNVILEEKWLKFSKTSPYGMTDLEITRNYRRKLYIFRRAEDEQEKCRSDEMVVRP